MSESNSTKICFFDGCGRKIHGTGLCGAHYCQKRTGRPLFALNSSRRPKGSPPRIVFDEVICQNDQLKGPCHVFRGCKTRKGYARIGINGKQVAVHRYVWEKNVGQLPAGMVIDHMCRNRACCNVEHLRVVSGKTNTLDNSVALTAINAKKTHCPKGHLYDKSSVVNGKDGNKQRLCKICQKRHKAKWYRKTNNGRPLPTRAE